MSTHEPKSVMGIFVAALLAMTLGWGNVTAAQSSRMTDEEFHAALAQLDSPLPDQRVAAANAIGTRGNRYKREATDKLRQLLRADTDVRVRAEAGRAIGRLGLRDAVPDLIGALADSESAVRVVAAAALWRLPDPAAVPGLIGGLSDADATVREWCALAVGVTGDARAVAPLIATLRDPAAPVRLESVRSLARIADPASMEPLALVAQDGDESDETRLEAVNAIAAANSPDRSNVLVRLLDVADLAVRTQVVRALGQVGDALVIPALRRAQQRPGASRLGPAIREAISAIERRSAAPAPAQPGTSGGAGSTRPTSSAG